MKGIGPALVATLIFWRAPLVQAEVVLFEQGQRASPIYVPAQPAAQEKTAAAELATYLQRISGGTFAVQPRPTPLPERGIFVGIIEGAPADRLGPDEFRLRAQGQRLFIAGGSPQGTLYGAYYFLEQLGCRWWSHDEEDIPTLKTISVADQGPGCPPRFFYTHGHDREAQSSQNHFADKVRTTSREGFTGGHTLYGLLTPHAQEHPEIYPLDKNGERKPNKLHFCYIAPGIAEALADALAKKVEMRKGDLKNTIYFAGMGDWYGGQCQCEACKKIYEEETWTDPDGSKKPGYTGTLLRMINKTAELLDRKYPGIRVGTFAYMSLEAPPAKTVPARNVIIRVPRLRHCTVHAAETCPKNRSFLRNLERWCELAPGRVYVWEYGASFKHFLCPFPCLYSMADNLRLYQKLGVKGVEIQGNYVSTGGDMAVLKNYVWRKLFWDPSLDPRALVREFCLGYYGPAAEEMMAYVEALEKSVREPKSTCADEFAGFNYLTDEVRGVLERHRGQALARARGQAPFERRVHEATVSLDALAVWKTGPLAERDGELVRQDLEGAYTLPRAEEVNKYIRNASPNEWSSGRAARMVFLTYQGGPLATMTRGPLTVKVAPTLNGQIRQITFQGKDLLYVENKPNVKGYPMLGGSIEGLGTRMMVLVEDPTPTRVQVQGEGGISLWGGQTQSLIHKTVELTGEGTIASTSKFRHAGNRKGDGPAGRVATVYQAKKPASVVVAYLTKDNRWQAVPFVPGSSEVELPATAALRIGLSDQECVVLDRYLGPGASGGKILLDPRAQTLTTVVQTAPVSVPAGSEQTILERRIEVAPLKAEGR